MDLDPNTERLTGINRWTDTNIVDRSVCKKARREDEGIDGLSGQKRSRTVVGAPQEQLINGCCDVVKGKVAAWSQGRLMKMEAVGP